MMPSKEICLPVSVIVSSGSGMTVLLPRLKSPFISLGISVSRLGLDHQMLVLLPGA